MRIQEMNEADAEFTLSAVKIQFERLVVEAGLRGIVVTVEQKPLKPLAMGHYETVVSVRPGRK